MVMVLFNPSKPLWQSNAVISSLSEAETGKTLPRGHTTNRQPSQDLRPTAVCCGICVAVIGVTKS